jgi:hypothetical protein
VIGTEDSRVLLLGAGCTSVSSSITLPAVPALLSAAGGLDAGYRVTVAARDGWLYGIKAGALTRTVIQLDSQPVGLVGAACLVQCQPCTQHQTQCADTVRLHTCARCCGGASAELTPFAACV